MFKNINLKFLIFLGFLPLIAYSQKKILPYSPREKPFTCTTFVYNLTVDEMKMKDICFEVIKGKYTNMNEFSSTNKKENEIWRFQIIIKDNQSLSRREYEASFYIYENYSQDFVQYHPVVENDEFKAIIYDKIKNNWQILLLQNDEFKILSSYTGYNYTNAFGITKRKKSSIIY